MDGLYSGWGEKLRERREALKLTQEQLAEATGLRQSTISRIEKGEQCPSDRAKWLLAGALRVRVEDVFPYPGIVPPIPEVAA